VPSKPDPFGETSPVEKLSKAHDLSAFDCGKESLNVWLKRWALTNQASDSGQTYVLHRDDVVIGYYTLTAGSVRPEDAPARISKGLAKNPIGVILLARMAIDKREHGKGLGSALLKDALLRVMAAADTVGARALLVHALDDEARAFYERFDFERSPVHEYSLMLLTKEIRRMGSESRACVVFRIPSAAPSRSTAACRIFGWPRSRARRRPFGRSRDGS
jgi:GNAT superfamily N-acetyltransferase